MAHYYVNSDGSFSVKRTKKKEKLENTSGAFGEARITAISDGKGDKGLKITSKPKATNGQKDTKTVKSTQTINVKPTITSTLKNSAIKNNGFNLSNTITDVANMKDAVSNTVESVPILGSKVKKYKTIGKTAGNIATNMAEGALDTLEGVGDWATSINPTDAVSAWAIEKIYGKKKADKFKKEAEKNTKDFLKRNLSDEFKETIGFNDAKQDWEKNSLIKSENIGGKVAHGIGGMVPALVAGQYLGLNPKMASKETIKSLQGLSKAKAIAGNVGKDFIAKLPSNAILGTSSYGSGVQEALQDDKVSLEQAKKFGLSNAASEIVTEYLTGGLPGLQGTGGLDYFADAGIDKLSKGYIKDLLKFGYQGAGEGLEEKVNTYLTALAKQNILNQKQDWKQVEKESNQAALIGALTGSFLNSSSLVQDVQNTRANKTRNINQNLTPIEKVQNLNEVEREALTEVAQKRKSGIPLTDQDYAVIGTINNNFVNNSVDSQRNQNYAENLQLPQQNQNVQPIEQQTQPQTVQNQPVQAETALPNINNQIEQNVAQNENNIDYDNKKRADTLRLQSPTTISSTENNILQQGQNVNQTIENNQNMLYNENTNAKGDVENEFRNIQEASRKMSDRDTEMYHSGEKRIDEGVRRGLSDVLGRKLRTQSSSSGYGNTSLVNPKTNKSKNFYTDVDAKTFHDNMEIVQKYLRNGDAVDVHELEDYNDTKNYLSDDGLSGFAITKNGDLISVFNLGEKGYLDTIAPEVKKNAKTLDCFQNDIQPLADMYEKKLGFKKAAIMDFNYDFLVEDKGKDYADYFVKTYGESPVVFMVQTDQNVELKHFNKDQYGEAMEYRDSFVNNEETGDMAQKKQTAQTNAKDKSQSSNRFNEQSVSNDDISQQDQNVNLPDMKEDNVLRINTPKEVSTSFNEAKNGKLDARKLRSWVETSNEATNNQHLLKKADQDKIRYEIKSNQETYNKAKKNTDGLSYEEKVFRAADKLNSNKKVTATDLVEAQMALLEANERGDIKTYLNLQQDIAIMGTELGQAVQAFSMIQKMSPDGQIALLNKIVAREQKLGNSNFEGVKLNEKLVQKVLDSYDDASHTTFNKEKMDESIDELKQDIANQMSTTRGEKINNWRYLSMLGNPKTHVRNVVANVAMSTVKKVKDTLSAVGQDVFIKDSSKKTTTLKKTSQDVKALADVAYEETFKLSKGNKYNEKSELETRKKIFNNKVLEAARKLNEKALDAEDQAFKKINFKKSFSKYLTAQGIESAADINNNPEIVQAAKAFALQEAKVATFQQDNKLATYINKLDNLGTPGKVIRGAIIPFTRTPLNIAKTGIEYTPGVGLATAISDMKKAPDNMKGSVLIDGISKQITGSSLALLGYALAQSGFVTADEGEDKESKFEKDQGSKMGFSIKIGDNSYDLSWLSPSSMPFFVGARMQEVLENEKGMGSDFIIESLASTIDPLSEMSCIKSFTDVLKSFSSGSMGKIKDMAESTIQNYISQFVPTVSSQWARLFDTKQRNSDADVSSNNKFAQETYRQLAYKIPGLRNTLPERTDIFGDAKKETDSALLRAFESFLSPANKRKDTMSKQSKELLRVYKKTGNTDIIPSALNSYVKFDNEDFKMSQKEYNQYKKEFGKAFKNNLKDLMDSAEYKNASDDEKADMIKGIMDYSKDKTKDIFLTNKGKDYVKTNKKGEKSYYESAKVDKLTNNNFSIADYYTYKVNAPNVVSGNIENQKKKLSMVQAFDMDPEIYSEYLEEKSSIKGKNKKRDMMNYINSFDLTDYQKAALFKQNYKSYKAYDNTIIQYIDNADLTVEEKQSLANFLRIQ